MDGGLATSLDHLGEDTLNAEQAVATATAYVNLLNALHSLDLTRATEVSVKLSAIGQSIDTSLALDNARHICTAAQATGTTVTLDMEDHTTTDSTLETLSILRQDFPTTGAVLQAYLKRTEADCRSLAVAGSRVRLCKGAYNEPSTVAFSDRGDIDANYLNCLEILMSGDGYPMVATHDPQIINAATDLIRENNRPTDTYEFQMLFGVRPEEQRRLVGLGHMVRVYVPYGQEWYGYLMRRMAERPANLTLFLRSLTSRR